MSLKPYFTNGEKLSASREKEILSKLKKEYSIALKAVREVMGIYYTKYDMTFTEMQKYNRMKALQEELRLHLARLSGASEKNITKGASDIYRDAYFTTAYAMESEMQAKLGYTMIDSKVISASVQNPISGLTLKKRMEEQRRSIITRINSIVTQGLIRGDGYVDMARGIQNGLELEYNKAVRIARTEAHRCQVIGRRDSLEKAEEAGVKGSYVWDSAIDERTRAKHRSMDGKKADKDGLFTTADGYRGKGPGNMGVAHHDINCRCSIRYEIEGFEPKQRRVRGAGVVDYATYPEYMKKRFAKK